MEPARRPHLVSCPHCEASNPVNASTCWQCEHRLRDSSESPVPASESPAVETDAVEPDAASAAPPSFFPVLREERDGVVAHNDSVWGGAPPEPPPLASWATDDPPARPARPERTGPTVRLVAAALGGAAIASLVFLWTGRSEPEPPAVPVVAEAPAPAETTARPNPEAAPTPVAPANPAPPLADAGARTTVPAAVAPVSPVSPVASATPRAPRAPRAPSRVEAAGTVVSDPAAPSPAPVPGPCTPNVAALGLCSIDAR